MPNTIDKAILPAIAERLRKNETALIAESKALGFSHNGPLRAALRELLGDASYSEMMQSKRPPRVEGAPKAKRETAPAVPLPSDEGLPVISSMRKSDGWNWRNISEHHPRPRKIVLPEGETTVLDGGKRLFVMKNPDGVEFVQAHPLEAAHLLVKSAANPDGSPVRLVRWEESAMKARIEKERRQWEGAVEQAAESTTVKKAAKKAEKQAADKAEADQMRESADAIEAQGRPKDAAKIRKVADAKDKPKAAAKRTPVAKTTAKKK